ncbi:hypothetical protein GN956_G4662 [Arapaima gigas]
MTLSDEVILYDITFWVRARRFGAPTAPFGEQGRNICAAIHIRETRFLQTALSSLHSCTQGSCGARCGVSASRTAVHLIKGSKLKPATCDASEIQF